MLLAAGAVRAFTFLFPVANPSAAGSGPCILRPAMTDFTFFPFRTRNFCFLEGCLLACLSCVWSSETYADPYVPTLTPSPKLGHGRNGRPQTHKADGRTWGVGPLASYIICTAGPMASATRRRYLRLDRCAQLARWFSVSWVGCSPVLVSIRVIYPMLGI